MHCKNIMVTSVASLIYEVSVITMAALYLALQTELLTNKHWEGNTSCGNNRKPM